MVKRLRKEGDLEDTHTPKRARRTVEKHGQHGRQETHVAAAETPSKHKSVLRGTPSKANKSSVEQDTPASTKKVLFSTPSTAVNRISADAPNDRSAHRKSAQTLQRHAVAEEDSDNEVHATDKHIASAILDNEEDEESTDEASDDQDPLSLPDTPSKPSKARGRPKGRRRARTPSPPPDLPSHELYFFQNRAAANKTSTSTFPSATLLNHDEYKEQAKTGHESHEHEVRRLTQLHRRAFGQWTFEIEEGFNVCLYGFGSKRKLMLQFAEHVFSSSEAKLKTVVINGYVPDLNMKDVLATIASQVLPKNTKLPAQPAALLDTLLSGLTQLGSALRIVLIIHSLDSPHLRKTASQTMLARLADHPSISLVASCDNPNFALLWDLDMLRQLNFLFHDATTFEPYELEIDVVEGVNILLGRSSRRLAGKDGVGYVLRSLPENARNLFRILVAEQMTIMSDDAHIHMQSNQHDEYDNVEELLGASDDDAAAMQQDTPSRRGRGRKSKRANNTVTKSLPKAVISVEGVEYRTLYHKAVEEFVCSSEMNFRTLLKEFHDHQMIESRKDSFGTERLVIPFRREELEAILEEL